MLEEKKRTREKRGEKERDREGERERGDKREKEAECRIFKNAEFGRRWSA